MGWVSRWDSHWLAIPPVSALVFAPAHLVFRKHFGLKALWVGYCPYLCTGSPAWLQEVVTSASIPPLLGVSGRAFPIDPLGPLLIPGL